MERLRKKKIEFIFDAKIIVDTNKRTKMFMKYIK